MSAGPPMTFMPGNRQLLGRAILATADVTALARLLVDAYQATITLERDIAANAAHYQHQTRLAQFEHEQIMQAMELGFERQDRAIETIERMATQLIARDQFELAETIISKLMDLLLQSPVKEAYSGRSSPTS